MTTKSANWRERLRELRFPMGRKKDAVDELLEDFIQSELERVVRMIKVKKIKGAESDYGVVYENGFNQAVVDLESKKLEIIKKVKGGGE
jgi:hypothetical protein